MSTADARGHRIPSGTDQASRQALLDLSLSIPSIKAVASQAAGDLHVQALAAVGVNASPESPVFTYRTDIGVIQAWNGSSWRTVEPPRLTDSPTMSSGWSNSKLTMSRAGGIVTLTGTAARTGYEPITAAWYQIGTIPSGWRPSQELAPLGANLVFPAVSIVQGGTTLNDSLVRITANTGALWVSPNRTVTAITMSVTWPIP